MARTNPGRSLARRISYGILRGIFFYIFTNCLIGACVGFVAGSGTTTFEAGAIAGQRASAEFFREFGWIILLVQGSIFTILCFYGLLPGVGKHKKVKEAQTSDVPPPPDVFGLPPDH
ncbi:MAG: hypothetical protein ACJ73D_13815 [Pyrinomonadaceae bacterium]